MVIRRLSAIEDLGNIEVLCTDKTGTLTQNKPSLEKIVSSDKNKCLLYSILTIENFLDLKINQKILDPFDLAVTERISEEILRKAQEYKIIFELPFDSYRMMASVLAENQNNKEKFLIVKGAPELVIEKCPQFSGRFTHLEILEDIKREGSEGKRVLAIAYKKITKDQITKDDERDLTFLGYFVFEDPLKATAKEAIELSKKLGVQIKILTGDSKEVAIFTAKKIGLIFNLEKVISGKKLLELNPDDFDNACEEKMVFARVSPDIKHKIIKSLQKKYQVGFLGEGINDAPAIKAANVGIVVAGASEVTRETADVVLLEKDLRVIVNGIKEGRTIFSNINKYIKCALASNFGNFYSIAVISLFINFLPMLPLQILLGNILSDFPLISIANDSVDVEELRKPKMYQLHMVLPLIVSLALVSTVFDFIFFTIFLKQQPAVIQTLWFIESILTEILLIFVVRTRRGFWQAKQPARWLTVFTIIDAIFIVALPFLKIGQNWFHFVALPILPLLIVFFLVAAYFMVSEFVKLAYFRYWKPKNSVVS